MRIPEDILEASEVLVDNMPARIPFKHEIKDLVSNAVLAERERCANIAANYLAPPGSDCFETASLIAHEIRAGNIITT